MSESKAVAVLSPVSTALVEHFGGRERVDLIKSKMAPGIDDANFALFLSTAKHLGLDPVAGQIYTTARNAKTANGGWEKRWTTIVSLEGYLSRAENTGEYGGITKTEFSMKEDKKTPDSCTVTVVRLKGDVRFETSHTCFYDEFVQTNKEGQPMEQWKKMPRQMLAKVSTVHALRRAFPNALSGSALTEEEYRSGAHDAIAPSGEDTRPPVPEGDLKALSTLTASLGFTEAQLCAKFKKSKYADLTMEDVQTALSGLAAKAAAMEAQSQDESKAS